MRFSPRPIPSVGFWAILVLVHGPTATAAAPASGTDVPAGSLVLRESAGVFTVLYGGSPGEAGIPSWRAVLRRDDGGNISALHVPADSPRMLSARENSQWPLAVVMASTKNEQLPATMTRGREAFARFVVDTFEVVENANEKIVVRIGGPSKHTLYEHQRTYTFTPEGVQIQGEVNPLVDMRSIGVWGLWDRRQIADMHTIDLPVRTQGRESWRYMAPTGHDWHRPLPEGVQNPFEAELMLRRATPTFVRIFVDRNFERPDGVAMLMHTNKDMIDRRLPSYEKLISIHRGALPKGEKVSYQLRFRFETQQWP